MREHRTPDHAALPRPGARPSVQLPTGTRKGGVIRALAQKTSCRAGTTCASNRAIGRCRDAPRRRLTSPAARCLTARLSGHRMTVAFVFPGQGSQAVGMGKALADEFAAARQLYAEVDAALHQKLTDV